MNIDVEKLYKIVIDLKNDIHDGCCSSSVSIAKLGGVTFELIAYSREEAEEAGISAPRDEHECITK